MKKHRLVLALIACVMLCGVFRLWLRGTAEPMYSGKRAGEWFHLTRLAQRQEEAHGAFRAMGKDGVLFLADILFRQSETAIGELYRNKIHPRIPESLSSSLPDPNALYDQKVQAIAVLGELGTNAVTALPDMLRAVEDPRLFGVTTINKKTSLLWALINIIGLVAPDTAFERQAVEVLVKVSEDPIFSGVACYQFARFPHQTALTIPVLIKQLERPAHTYAILALGELGDRAIDAVPLLEKFARGSPSDAVTQHATEALARIRVQSAMK